jgi:hypothetical protein
MLLALSKTGLAYIQLPASRDWYETCLYTIRDKIYQTLPRNI